MTMATRGTTAAGRRRFLNPADSRRTDVDMEIGFMKDYLMELVMMLFEVELMHANGTKVMKVFVVMTKGATGMFTTSHAVCVEAVNVTYWLVVWPTLAEEGPRHRVKRILGGKWPMDYAGTVGNAAKFSGGLKGMPTPPMLLMENRGNDIEADPTKTVEAPTRAELTLGEAQSPTETSYGGICGTSPRGQDRHMPHPVSLRPASRAAPRREGRGHEWMKETWQTRRRRPPEAVGIVIRCRHRAVCKPVETPRRLGRSSFANSEHRSTVPARVAVVEKLSVVVSVTPRLGGTVAIVALGAHSQAKAWLDIVMAKLQLAIVRAGQPRRRRKARVSTIITMSKNCVECLEPNGGDANLRRPKGGKVAIMVKLSRAISRFCVTADTARTTIWWRKEDMCKPPSLFTGAVVKRLASSSIVCSRGMTRGTPRAKSHHHAETKLRRTLMTM